MEQKTKKVSVIALEDLPKVLEEVTKELNPLLSQVVSPEEQEAAHTFFGTLTALALDIFKYLPPEQQGEILTNCGTWFDLGMLLGKSPQLLQDILNRVNPKVRDIEIPWFAEHYPHQKG